MIVGLRARHVAVVASRRGVHHPGMGRRSTVGAFVGSRTALVGRYTYRPKSDQWWWSDAVFLLHGFEPGAVVPTTELVLRHIHPDDRLAAWESRETALDVQEPFTFLHRIVRADGRERIVIAAGHLEEDDDGVPVVVGHLVDLTDVLQDAVSAAVDPAVADFNEHRAVIEQAKGVLMQLYSVDTDTAFALLQAFSMSANRKVREVAASVVVAASVGMTPVRGDSPSAHDLLKQLFAARPEQHNEDGQPD